MAGFSATEVIQSSVDKVFHFVMDTENAPKVIRNVKKMEQITPGDVGVGTRFRETRVINGKEEQTELTVTAFEPPGRYSVSTMQSGITVIYHYHFLPQGNVTRVNLECEIKANGLKKLMIPLVSMVMKKEDGDHLKQLKRAIEEKSETVSR